jgi:serine/threonine protein kinase/Flp pilus assembly protein TadD
MTVDRDFTAAHEQRFNEVVAAYLEAVEAGLPADRERLLAEHPALASQLRAFFTEQDQMASLAAPVRAIVQGAPAAGLRLHRPTPAELGDFRILREIGRGGMGIVYEAEQVSLGRKVALKVLPALATLDPRRLQRFHNEARAAAGLHHTNIVPVFAVGADHGVHFYAMQLIDGQTLAEVLGELRRSSAGKDRAKPEAVAADRDGEATAAYAPPPGVAAESTTPQAALSTEGGVYNQEYMRAVARLGVQAAEALDYAHQLGVVHRDVKPGNLMVDGRGQLWVTDFGLAQLSEGGQSLTLTGDLVGTVRYMSPEQALAQRVVIDHRTDVYSLGATLYELLTLRPVFGGDSREELLRQIAFEEPRPLRKLNRAIPAELETIVLKALEKNPAERYATAQELADDLHRFLEDKPILARRPSLVQRARKWARRHRTVVGAVSAVLLVAAVLGAGSWLWWEQKRAGAEGEARAALREAAALLEQERWPEALSAARRAEGVLAGVGADPALWREARTLIEDVEMAQRLQEASLEVIAASEDGDLGASDAAYAAAFAAYGLDVDRLDARSAAERIRTQPIHRQLVAALDDWAYMRKRLRAEGWKQRLAVARAADPDTWRGRLRDALEGTDPNALKEAAAADRAEDWPVQSLVLLGRLARGTPSAEQVAGIVGRAQLRHPADFWLNDTLGELFSKLRPARPGQVLRFWSIAVALRPQSPAARISLGSSLHGDGRLAEAVAAYREALRLKKDSHLGHNNLGVVLVDMGRLDEAIAEFRQALRLKKDYAEAHSNLGDALRDEEGLLDEAIAECREALRLKPNYPMAHANLGFALYKKGRPDNGIAELREALRLDKNLAVAHNNLGYALAGNGPLNEAIAEFREALRLKEDYPEAHYNLGLALQNKGQLDEAIAEYREALRLKKDFPEAHCNLGHVLRDQGQLEAALASLRRGHALGSQRRGWPYPSAQWVKDCEQLVAQQLEQEGSQLAAILRGAAHPADASERTRLAELCLRHGHSLAAARLCKEGFDDLIAPGRYVAACAAAQAGTGQGKDADKLPEAERTGWRNQALAWLRPDLLLMEQNLKKNPGRWRAPVLKELQHWRTDPSLAAVRDEAALAKLPAEEAEAWRRLWADVRGMIAAAGDAEHPRDSAAPGPPPK